MNHSKKILLLASLFLMPTLAMAQIAGEKFTSLCIEELSVGIQWQNGEYKPMRFREGKYTLKNVILESLPDDWDERDRHYAQIKCQQAKTEAKNCYSITKFGEKSGSYSIKTCMEFSRELSSGKSLIEEIHCPSFKANPNGRFHKGHVMQMVDDSRAASFVSSYVSTGRCTVIN